MEIETLQPAQAPRATRAVQPERLQPESLQPARPPSGRPLLRAVPGPAPVPTKLCPDSHANNPPESVCRVCAKPFQAAAEIISMAPSVVARLILEDGSTVAVTDRLVIGRSPDRGDKTDTLTVPGRQVSRRHAMVDARGWELRIKDLDSTNGTYLTRRGERGRRRVPADSAIPVRIGDSIHFGSRQALVVQP